ncbi:hypothetical protein [Chelatococcus reniformis]|uniref:hypothetical protein n=1 Tax=Chelatococcus reniformis TaxID=1494448 RepID=UPI00166EFAD0|nr:hypothetical protein [Chelatococcus reniformis]
MSPISKKIYETLARRPHCLRIAARGGAEFVVPTDNMRLTGGKVFWEDDVGLWCLPVEAITRVVGDFWNAGPPGTLVPAPTYWAAGRA